MEIVVVSFILKYLFFDFYQRLKKNCDDSCEQDHELLQSK